MCQKTEQAEEATLEEVETALRDLHKDKLVLRRLLAFTCKKVAYNKFHAGEDVLNEAFERMLDGRRPWNKKHSFLKHTYNAVRSIGFEFNKESDLERFPVVSPHDTPSEDGGEIVVACNRPLVDFAIEAQETHKAFWELFADDENCQAVLLGREDYMTASQIKEAFGLTETQYDSAIKQIRRLMNKHYPKGIPL